MNLSLEQEEILGRAIRTWGTRQQVIKAIEEMQELTQVLCKWLNLDVKVMNGGLKESKILDAINEETADVCIMINQLRTIFGDQYLQNYVDAKIMRLNSYIPKERK